MIPLRTLVALAGTSIVGCLAGCLTSMPGPAPIVTPATTGPLPAGPPGKPLLLRGINFGNALDAPTEGAWGVTLEGNDFVAMRQAGFDHVRLPIRFNAHAGTSAPYTVDSEFFRRVDWALNQALGNGLAVIVDFHHYVEMMDAPDANRERFLAIWRQVAEHFRDRPEAVCFEVLNEPSGNLTAEKWNPILADALKIIRASNPTRTVIVEGVFWASAKNLRDTLQIPAGDTNLVGSFHMYQPILFTHQGSEWMPPEYGTRDIVFPGPPASPISPVGAANAVPWVHDWFKRYNEEPAARNPSGPTTIAEEMDMAKAFADRTHLRVYMGEFGAIDKADPKSRELWTRMTRVEAERRGFGWAYWDDGGNFKAYDRSNHTWIPSLKAALLH